MTREPHFIRDGLDLSKVHFATIDGLRTRYYEDGEGEPLILISGGSFGSLYSLDSFSINLPELAKHFHVYALDKPGQGFTESSKGEADFTHAGLIRHTLEFMKTLGIPPAHFVGHSRGGLHISWFALQHPDMVRSLVLVDSRSTAPDHPDYPLGLFYDNLPRPTPGPPSRATVRIEPDAQAFHPEQVTDDFLDRLVEIANLPQFQESQRRIEDLNASVWRPDLFRIREETLKAIDERGLPVPTLLIWAADDKSAPLMLGIHLWDRIRAKTRSAEMHVLNCAGHYCFRDQPDAFNRVLRSFCLL